MKVKKRNFKKRLIVISSVIIAIAIIGIIGYNVIGDYAVDFMLKFSTQTLIDQGEKDFKKDHDKIVKDYDDKIKGIEKNKLLPPNEKEKAKIEAKVERDNKIKEIEKNKAKLSNLAKVKIPEDIKKQILALAIKGLGADGVSRCMSMLNGGLTAEEKSELKLLFKTKFSASEQAQILEWAKIYSR